MITYNRTAFGLNLIFRIHGSAVYRSVVPSLLSVCFFFLIRKVYQTPTEHFGEDLGHPYAIGVLVSTTTFLIVFRVNQGYNRYWEAAGATQHMMSKWMDATIHSGVYHLQCDHYKDLKPPSYFDYPEFNHMFLTRDRERGMEYDDDEDGDSSDHLNNNLQEESLLRNRKKWKSYPGHNSNNVNKQSSVSKQKTKEEHTSRKIRSVTKSINYIKDPKKRQSTGELDPNNKDLVSEMQDRMKKGEEDSAYFDKYKNIMDDDNNDNNGKPYPLLGKPRLDGNWGALYNTNNTNTTTTAGEDPKANHNRATFYDPQNPDKMDPQGFASIQGGRTPPLFLQELAHLSSLLVAVALSTLRNDIEGAESPLAMYKPGQPWPEVDPDKDEWFKLDNMRTFIRNFNNFIGIGRTPEDQTRHNAARPLPVIGGVSDNEIRFLQMARGPYAKTQLCWNWLSEFCIREHLAGSMGKVGPPIISRNIQFLSDGMIYYNHARKIMFIPFPFVHAQLSVLFILVMVPCIPFLMDQYTDEAWVGSTLTFFTVLCLSGIHEVARELENPFRNVPNELPLVTLQAQYNEALITMYSGFHPDHFWDGERILRKRGTPTNTNGTSTPPTTPPRKASSPNNGDKTTTTTDADEIALLKQQLAEQAKLIERLAAKMSFNPEEETQQLETIVERVQQQMANGGDENVVST